MYVQGKIGVGSLDIQPTAIADVHSNSRVFIILGYYYPPPISTVMSPEDHRSSSIVFVGSVDEQSSPYADLVDDVPVVRILEELFSAVAHKGHRDLVVVPAKTCCVA